VGVAPLDPGLFLKIMPWAIILISATTAGILDLREQRIPNWLVILTIAVSLVFYGALGGVHGLWSSALGMLIGVAVLFPLFLLRGMGAGDVKFFGALGAAVTYKYVFVVLFISVVVAAALALFRIFYERALLSTLANMGRLISWLGRGHFTPHPLLNITSKGALSVPFGVAIAIASWIFLLVKLR
jgi:prepilin peptidase CpaA